MKIRAVVLFALVLGLPRVALCRNAEVTAAQVLQRVSETYQNLRNYHLVADRASSVRLDSSGHANPPVQEAFDLAVEKPGRVRLDYKEEGGVLIVVSDGAVTWRYIPQRNAYTRENVALSIDANARNAGVSGENDVLTEAFDNLVSRYCGLAQYAAQAVRERDKSLKFERKKLTCYIVKLKLLHSLHTLWIDPESFLVLRHEEFDRFTHGAVSGTYSYTLNLKAATISGPLDQSLFEFSPPKHAREVASLGLPGEGTHMIGQAATNFSLKDLEGKKINLSDYRGKVVLLDFWATWCPPCRKELPEIAKLYAAYKDKGLVVLGVSNEGGGVVKRFFQSEGYSFPTLIDSDKKVGREYGTDAIPDVFVIDAQGVIRSQHVGLLNEQDLVTALQSAGLRTSF